MRRKRLNQILRNLTYSQKNHGNPWIQGISFDSREVQPGDIFFALPGTRKKGIQFIPQAIQKGAHAVVVEESIPWREEIPLIQVKSASLALGMVASNFFDYPTHHLTVIGITGTNGKTTTSYLLRSILKAKGDKTALLGTIENHLDEESLPSHHTTPSSLEIHRFSALALQKKCQTLIMEVSSHGLVQNRIAGVNLDGAIFTNLSGDHLDYHKSMENYREAKSRLFQAIQPYGFAVFNGDDPSSFYMVKKSSVRNSFYGIHSLEAEYRALHIQMDLHGSRFILEGPNFRIPVSLPLVGIHNIYNSLAAASLASLMGVHPGFIQKGLESAPQVPGRLEYIPHNGNFHVFVDYAHTDDALQNVLSKLAELKKGRLITVFGCGGDRDKTKRPRMAKVSSQWSDWTILTSDNPRSEEPMEILKDIEKGMTSASYEIIENRKEAILQALKMAKKDDIVLIAGKGHETYQEGKKGRIWFDDRWIAREFLLKKAS